MIKIVMTSNEKILYLLAISYCIFIKQYNNLYLFVIYFQIGIKQTLNVSFNDDALMFFISRQCILLPSFDLDQL